MLAGAHSRQKVSICLVEHNPLAAERLLQVLEADAAIHVFSCQEVLGERAALRKDVSIFVIDQGTLPDPLSKYLRFVRFHLPELKPIVLDVPQPPGELLTLLVLGTKGFVTYSEACESLCAAVRAVNEGHLWFAPDILEQYVQFSSLVAQAKAGGDSLTPRERRIVGLLKRRLANKEIAAILGISENTVKFHLSNIYNKLGVSDRQSAVEVANTRKLVEPLEPLGQPTH